MARGDSRYGGQPQEPADVQENAGPTDANPDATADDVDGSTREERIALHEETVKEKLRRGETVFSEGELEFIASKLGLENSEHPYGNTYTAENSPNAGTVAPHRAASEEHRLTVDAEGNDIEVDENGYTEEAKEQRERMEKAAAGS